MGERHDREGAGRRKMPHLHEVVIANSRVWLKLQGSCVSCEQAEAFFGCRFTGTDRIVDERVCVTPFRLSERSGHVANWASIVDRLPAGWDDEQFQIAGSPYPWCETRSEGCDCHGEKGRLDIIYCSDFGLHEETDRRARKSENVWYRHHVRMLEQILARRDEAGKRERLKRGERGPPPGAVLVAGRAGEAGEGEGAALPGGAIEAMNRLVAQGMYCSIHGRWHGYDDHAIRQTLASLRAACAQVSRWGQADRALAMARMGNIAAHCLGMHQSAECAQKSVWGDADTGNTPEPLGPTQRRRAPVRIEPVQERTFAIAHHHGLESSLEPHQRLGRVRTAVDQIANPEKAVGNGIKAKFGQGAIQGAKAAMHVANDKIAPARIGANSAGPDTLHGRSPQSNHLAGFRRERQT